MRLHELLRSLNVAADTAIRLQKEEGLKGSKVLEPDVYFYVDDNTEYEVVDVIEEGRDVLVSLRRAI